jgi:hypothetical protein
VSSYPNRITESVSPAQARSLALAALIPLFSEHGINGATLRESVDGLSWAAVLFFEHKAAMLELAAVFALLSCFSGERVPVEVAA